VGQAFSLLLQLLAESLQHKPSRRQGDGMRCVCPSAACDRGRSMEDCAETRRHEDAKKTILDFFFVSPRLRVLARSAALPR
jgi:hypothetical protein